MKLRKSQFRGLQTNLSNGTTWEIIGENPRYVVQAYKEYYGAIQYIKIYDTTTSEVMDEKAGNLCDLRNDTEDGLIIRNIIRGLGESK